MNNTFCWHCGRPFEYDGEKYRDINCPHCSVMNTKYNPADRQPYVPDGTEGEEMKPPKKEKTEFEKVAIGEFVAGIIEKIEYDNEHKFKGFQGGEDTVQPAIRFVFKFDDYKYFHYSRWMKFNAGEKANLYKKYLVKLVEGITPDADFDIDHLRGMKIKTIWEEQNDFQNIESIYPLDKKIPFTIEMAIHQEEAQIPEEDMKTRLLMTFSAKQIPPAAER